MNKNTKPSTNYNDWLVSLTSFTHVASLQDPFAAPVQKTFPEDQEKCKSTKGITISRIVDRTSSIGGLYVCAGGGFTFVQGAWHLNLRKVRLTYSVSYFNLGRLRALFGGMSLPKPPRGDGTDHFSDCPLPNSIIRVCASTDTIWTLVSSEGLNWYYHWWNLH